MTDRENTPKKFPACNSSFVTENLSSWICADCGATKQNPTSRKIKWICATDRRDRGFMLPILGLRVDYMP